MPAKKRGKSASHKTGRAKPGATGKKNTSGKPAARSARPLLVETARVAHHGPGPARTINERPAASTEAGEDYDEDSPGEKFMSVGDHLEEFRKRLLAIIVVVLGSALVAGIFVQEIHAFLIQPYRQLTGRALYLASVYGPMEILIELAITVGITVSLPISIFILWGFITPALSRRGAIIGNISILASSLLFWAGMAFCWNFLLPLTLKFFFITILPEGTEAQITLEKYYSFFFLMHIGAGLSFQFPLVVLLLGALGILPLAWHRRSFRYIIVGIFAFAGIITADPNPMNQLAMGGVLTVLYTIALAILWVIERARRKRDEREGLV